MTCKLGTGMGHLGEREWYVQRPRGTLEKHFFYYSEILCLPIGLCPRFCVSYNLLLHLGTYGKDY